MDLTLYTEDYFNSAHLLKNYEGKCSQMHGHTWKVCVWIKGSDKQLNHIGLLWDFNNLKNILDGIDHKFLNEILNKNPTAENITIYIYEKAKKDSPDLKFRVRVYESIVKKESYCETGDF